MSRALKVAVLFGMPVSMAGIALFLVALDFGIPEWLAYAPVIVSSLILGTLIRRSLADS